MSNKEVTRPGNTPRERDARTVTRYAHEEEAAYEKLSPAVRECLRECINDFPNTDALQAVRMVGEAKAIRFIKAQDAKLTKLRAAADYGAEHPEAKS